jgi:hypothetical protein
MSVFVLSSIQNNPESPYKIIYSKIFVFSLGNINIKKVIRTPRPLLRYDSKRVKRAARSLKQKQKVGRDDNVSGFTINQSLSAKKRREKNGPEPKYEKGSIILPRLRPYNWAWTKTTEDRILT